MKTISKAAQVAARLAMAVAVSGSLATAAHAAGHSLLAPVALTGHADEYRMNVADLDFRTSEGMKAYGVRADAFVQKVCDQETLPQNGLDEFLGDFGSCVRNYRAQADRNLNQQLAAIGLSNSVVLASRK